MQFSHPSLSADQPFSFSVLHLHRSYDLKLSESDEFETPAVNKNNHETSYHDRNHTVTLTMLS
jgi:hypothetical protein